MKEKATFMIFLVIVLVFNLVINIYIFHHTRAVFPAGKLAWWLATIIFWIIAFGYMAGRFSERSGLSIAEPFIRVGSFWLGAMTYLTLLFLLVDLLRGINGLFGISPGLSFNWDSEKGKVVVFAVYALSAIILAGGYFNAKFSTITRQQIAMNKPLAGGPQKVVLVSDIHLGMMISNGRLERLVSEINRQNADLVLMAGDVFDEDLGPVIKMNMGDLLKTINSRHGVYAILGNHEFYGNANEAQQYLENHNITVLRDSSATLANGITVIGREDITGERMYNKARKSLDELLAEVDTTKPVFVMDHQPFKLAEVAKHEVDLQVSGHTHHGQLWPFNFITKAMYELSAGYLQIANSHFYVSSGYGTWGPPIRTSSRSEIVVLEITGKP